MCASSRLKSFSGEPSIGMIQPYRRGYLPATVEAIGSEVSEQAGSFDGVGP